MSFFKEGKEKTAQKKDENNLYVVDNEDDIEKELEAANAIKKMELNVYFPYFCRNTFSYLS